MVSDLEAPRFFQDGLTGSAWGDWANYTDSPLRAFEGELGAARHLPCMLSHKHVSPRSSRDFELR